uniref:Peptidase M13 C-terminal domain-containing protein n=1 Tax=Hyaloperonospora arabidopsidis (strain Emoy2) TaxID=559515 RepID=M4BLC7_HYAAE
MTWKWTKVHDKDDGNVPVDVNGAVLAPNEAEKDSEQLLGDCKELNALQEGAVAAPPPFFMQKKPVAAWAVGSLGMLFLVVVISVIRGGTLHAPIEPLATINDAADWIELLPHDVVSHLDTQVDPCDDLYAFSCGSWLKQAEIPDDKSSVSLSFSTVHDENQKVLKEVMQQGWPLVGELYDSCMNFSNTSSATADAASVAVLSPALKQIAAVTSKSELFQLAGKLSKAGPDFLTGLGVSADAREATVYALYASQTGLSLPDPQYYLDHKKFETISDAFHAYVVELFSLVGSESREAASQASLVISFEQMLAPLFVPKEKLQDPVATYNRMSVAQAAENYPLLFAQFMNGTGILENLVARNTSVIVETPPFFERVGELVTGDSVTLDTLKAVLIYQYISAHASILSEPFVQASFSFFAQTLRGQKRRAPRWKVCVQRVVDNFPYLAGKYFALLRFDKASERLANQLVTQVQASFEKDLMHVDWLDEPTRQGAIDKLGNMTNLIGYSNRSEHFPYELHGDAPLAQNMRIVKEHQHGRAVARIGEVVDRNKWAMTGAVVNAYYQPTANHIVFPAGILQPPFFARGQHPARNFGAIGSIIGHELTHGFDASGRFFAGNGNLQDWWSNDTATEFLLRTDCLVRQYNEFAVTSGTDQDKVLGYVNGNYTLSENIADNGGVKLSFHAYETYVADKAKELDKINKGEATTVSQSQPGPDLPADVAGKLFFISFAQAFCSKVSDATMIKRLATDPHSPDQWRINGVASNSQDFARVFSCPAGSLMNPTKKCKLW